MQRIRLLARVLRQRTRLLARVGPAWALCAVVQTGWAAPDLSVVALGNSITRHGPASSIKWMGDWGMAATSAQTDYVGHLVRLLSGDAQAPVRAQRFNLAALEAQPRDVRAGLEQLAAGRASQLLVVELGDNVGPKSLADFEPAYARLLASAKPDKGLLVCLSTWWQSAAVDAIIEPACRRAGGRFVDIGDIHRKPGRSGSGATGITDPGVLRHPGDAGMAEIAERIHQAWRPSKAAP
jgi:hypothetical protein